MKTGRIRYCIAFLSVAVLLTAFTVMMHEGARRMDPYDVEFIQKNVFRYYDQHQQDLLSHEAGDQDFYSVRVDGVSDHPEVSITLFHTTHVNDCLMRMNIPAEKHTELIEKGRIQNTGMAGKGYMLLFDIENDWHCFVEYNPT